MSEGVHIDRRGRGGTAHRPLQWKAPVAPRGGMARHTRTHTHTYIRASRPPGATVGSSLSSLFRSLTPPPPPCVAGEIPAPKGGYIWPAGGVGSNFAPFEGNKGVFLRQMDSGKRRRFLWALRSQHTALPNCSESCCGHVVITTTKRRVLVTRMAHYLSYVKTRYR